MKIQFVIRDPNSIFYKVFIIIFLIAVTLSVYWQVKDHQFINFDDPYYVTSNSHVLTGLNIENIKWAFFSTYASNWHPITWISHMLDIQLFGMNPGMHHLVNVTFHILNTILLFIILNKMTGAMWRSAFVSALFALHPMHVESVAWISERKDVLSTLFWMLTMLAYYSYTRNRKVSRYMFTILFFGIGLMSKPMMVTLPFALLLLDFWPLNREGLISPSPDNGAICDSINIKVLFKLIIEKIPLIVLTLFACGITFYAQSTSGSVSSTSFAFRIQNVIISYVIYLWMLIWPLKIAVFIHIQKNSTC